MKRIFYILLISMGLILNSCKDLLDLSPMDQISDPEFWKTDGDLELYVNRLYDNFTGWNLMGAGGTALLDASSDIAISTGLFGTNRYRLDGVINIPATGGGWTWTNVRNVNYFFENADRVPNGGLKDQYVGEAYFLRAWFYFELLKQFGDLPIITKTLNPGDEELYGTRSSRTDVVNFMISDLDMAISKMKKKSELAADRLNRDIASLFKARVCLYEGTWEKYHQGTVFKGNSDGAAFLNQAALAAKAVIDGLNYSLVTGNTGKVYYELFNQIDYSKNTEVLFWKKYDKAAYGDGFGNQSWNHPNGSGITNEMMRMYLCSDGLPISLSPLYKGDLDIRQVVLNRDQRCVQTVMNPGDAITVKLNNDTTKFVTPMIAKAECPTAYESQKFRRPQLDPATGSYSDNMGFILFRYAEALLTYAEAKAELGQLTQADVDLTINKLRQRVGMPPMVLSSIATDPAWPDYGYSLPAYLQEIRRERIVELFSEGHHLNDLMRWRAHNLIVGKRPTGAFYSDELKLVNSKLIANSSGYLDPYSGITTGPNGGWGFNPAKNYLMPLPTNELTLNKNLKQNPGW